MHSSKYYVYLLRTQTINQTYRIKCLNVPKVINSIKQQQQKTGLKIECKKKNKQFNYIRMKWSVSTFHYNVSTFSIDFFIPVIILFHEFLSDVLWRYFVVLTAKQIFPDKPTIEQMKAMNNSFTNLHVQHWSRRWMIVFSFPHRRNNTNVQMKGFSFW